MRLLLCVVALLSLLSVPLHASAQSELCVRTHLAKRAAEPTLAISASDAERLVSQVAQSIGLKRIVPVVPCNFIEKAYAWVGKPDEKSPEREYIIYNPDWVREVLGKDEVQAVALFGHELGHFLNADFTSRRDLPRQQLERDADHFAGCAVARMSGDFARLEDLLSRLRLEKDAYYPDRLASLVSAKEGFKTCGGRVAAIPHSRAKVVKDCPGCPEMILIPDGDHVMGTSRTDFEKYKVLASAPGGPFQSGGEFSVSEMESEIPDRTIKVPSFYIGRTEVTQAEWWRVMGKTHSGKFDDCGGDCPVDYVTFEEAQTFARRLSTITGKRYRLPSEVEWEYACMGGISKSLYCGGDEPTALAWFEKNSATEARSVNGKAIPLHPVATRLPNGFGLHDMSGNVIEWVEDCWNVDYGGAPTSAKAWVDGDCSKRVIRGGSWLGSAGQLRAKGRAWRDKIPNWFNDQGFRVVRVLD